MGRGLKEARGICCWRQGTLCFFRLTFHNGTWYYISMRDIHPRNLQVHQTSSGREPFTEWFESIQDTKTQTRIEARLNSLKYGNFGDYQSVGGGVFELRLHFGSGYRIYFALRWITRLSFCSVGETSLRRREILYVQKPVGWNTRRHNGERTENMD